MISMENTMLEIGMEFCLLGSEIFQCSTESHGSKKNKKFQQDFTEFEFTDIKISDH